MTARPALAAALLFASGIHAQSIAEPVNRELPDWLRFSGEFRTRWEAALPRAFNPVQDDGYLLTRVRINLDFHPVRYVRLFFQAQDVRVFFNQYVPSAPPYRNPMDLRQGYLTLGDPAHSIVSLRAGRQDFSYGDNRILGPTNWSNQARSFDALRLTLRRGPDWLDVIASSVVVPADHAFDRPQAGSNIHGLYGHVENLAPHAVVEPYLLWRLAPGAVNFKTLGVRWVGKIKAWDYRSEMAWQNGHIGAAAMRAWAGHWMAGYTVPGVSWKPRLSVEYNHATGDKDPRDNRREAFDQLYPTGHDKYGLADQVGWRNIHNLRAGLDTHPTPKLVVWTNLHSWRLASARDALYSTSSAVVAVVPDGSAGRHVGEELDFQASYSLTKQTQLGGGVGHIFPGEFLKKATRSRSYTYPYVVWNYTF